MANKTEDKDKVRALLKYYKTNQTEFAARLGFSQSALAHWITRNKLPFDVMHKIAETCEEISFSWLVTGMGPMLLKDGGLTEEQMASDGMMPGGKVAFIPGLDCDEFVQCQGFSLEPTIHQGDFIGLKKLREDEVIDPERIYLVIMTDGTQMLRYVANIKEEEMYELTAETNRRSLQVPYEKIHILKKVVFVGKMI